MTRLPSFALALALLLPALAEAREPIGTLDRVIGGDTISGSSWNETILGGSGNDTLWGGAAGNDRLEGGEGDDVFLVAGNAGLDSFVGGAGMDTILGAAIKCAASHGVDAFAARERTTIDI